MKQHGFNSFTSFQWETVYLSVPGSCILCWQDQIDDACKVAGKSGDTRAEIQYGCSLYGFWGGSFCESREQHQQPRGSPASLCAGVDAHFESQLYADGSNFRSLPSSCLSSAKTDWCRHALSAHLTICNNERVSYDPIIYSYFLELKQINPQGDTPISKRWIMFHRHLNGGVSRYLASFYYL